MSNLSSVAQATARKLLDELVALDRETQSAYYHMGRLLYALDDLVEYLGYNSLSALVDEELIISPATAARYRNAYKHFKRLHYSEKEALDMIQSLSFSNVAPQIAHLKNRVGKAELAKKIDKEGHRSMTFWMTSAEYDEARKVLKTFGPRNVYHASESFLAMIKKAKK